MLVVQLSRVTQAVLACANMSCADLRQLAHEHRRLIEQKTTVLVAFVSTAVFLKSFFLAFFKSTRYTVFCM